MNFLQNQSVELIKAAINSYFETWFIQLYAGGALLLNHALRVFFFVLAFTSLVSWILIEFKVFFARQVGQNIIVKGVAFAVFFYAHIWDYQIILLDMAGYYCALSISRSLYDGVLLMGRRIRKSDNATNYTTLVTAIFLILGFMMLYLNKYQKQDQMKYPYLGTYFLMAVLLLIIGTVRKVDITYTLICLSMASGIVLTRHYCQKGIREDWFEPVGLPFEALFYIPFALQAEISQRAGQRSQNAKQVQVSDSYTNWPSQSLLCQTYYFIYFILSQRMFPIEIALVGFCLVSYLFPKKV